jgi:hypothetical protein
MGLPGEIVPVCVVMGGEALIAYFDVKDERGGVLGSGIGILIRIVRWRTTMTRMERIGGEREHPSRAVHKGMIVGNTRRTQ